jgi:hypothetical protein
MLAMLTTSGAALAEEHGIRAPEHQYEVVEQPPGFDAEATAPPPSNGYNVK